MRWAAGLGERRGETGPVWDLGWVSRAVWAGFQVWGFGPGCKSLGWAHMFELGLS